MAIPLEDLTDGRQSDGPPRRGSALPSPAPRVGTSTADLLAWASAAARFPAAIDRAQRWGSSADTPIVITLTTGERIRFAAARDLFDPSRLVQTIALQLGSRAPALPMFSKADAQDFAQVIVRACEAIEQDDERERTTDWQQAFTSLCQIVHHGNYADPAARWNALRWLTAWPAFDARAHRMAETEERYRPPMLVWADGTAMVRVADVEKFVRGVCGEPITAGAIVARMREAGWQHRRVDTWRPGAGRDRAAEDRIRVSAFVLDEPAASTENDVSPTVPLAARARVRTHARRESLDVLGTHGGSPVNPEDQGLGDTIGVGDTSPTLVGAEVWDFTRNGQAA